ncbi:hypothetical protein MTO96_028119 [Rhipicephalus appendiculatus]
MHDKGSNSRPLRERLDDFLLAYRTTPNTATGKCPAELFLKRTLRTKLSLLRPSFRDDMQRKQEMVKWQHDGRRSTFRLFKGDWVYAKSLRQEKLSWTEGRVVRTVSPVTYLVETQNTVRHVHVGHLRSRSSSQYAGSNIATEALRRPSRTRQVIGRLPPRPSRRIRMRTRQNIFPMKQLWWSRRQQGGQEWLLPVAHDELPQTPAEEPSDSPQALRRSQRARKEPDRYVPHDFRH